jgi:hypothetical protein
MIYINDRLAELRRGSGAAPLVVPRGTAATKWTSEAQTFLVFRVRLDAGNCLR